MTSMMGDIAPMFVDINGQVLARVYPHYILLVLEIYRIDLLSPTIHHPLSVTR